MSVRAPDSRPVGRLVDRLKQLDPARIDLSLDRVRSILERLGAPHTAVPPVIHIAGTNGKGSTLAFLRALLEAAGLRVHAYTSPHLCRFNERIVVAGRIISDTDLSDIVDTVITANHRSDITFFEATTAAAFLAFARTPADVTLLETGLGGRLDATNVIERPAVTGITPVGFDHTALLGTTLTAIAGEKAGIMKRGCPVVIGPQPAEAMTTLTQKADSLGITARVYGRDWTLDVDRDRPGLSVLNADGTPPRPLEPLRLMRGQHQHINAAMAIELADLFLGAPLQADRINPIVSEVAWPGRLQQLAPGPFSRTMPDTEIWVDAAHNDEGGRALSGFLDTLPPADTVLACGMYRGKDASTFLSHFRGRVSRVLALSVDGEQPAQDAEAIVTAARSKGLAAEAVGDCARLAQFLSQPPKRLVIAGSLAVIGAILSANDQCPQ